VRTCGRETRFGTAGSSAAGQPEHPDTKLFECWQPQFREEAWTVAAMDGWIASFVVTAVEL